MARSYDFKAVEAKWQRIWEEHKAFRVTEDPAKPKYYCLEMYPYPSGKIHMGHVRNYSIGDVVAWYLTMRGYNVLHPMGWDAFGFPAENAALELGIHPARWTYDNIASMKSQFTRMGFSYDWSREITSCSPDYYRWNQWFFLRMYERGLAYRKKAPVNWCEECRSVLSNEQAEGGVCWRHSDIPVVQKDLEQWFLRITAYVEELLRDLESLTGWPERVRVMQRNWIGRSVGAEVRFPIADGTGELTIFTTRPDTLYGATFMVVAPEHPIVSKLRQGAPQEKAVRSFVERQRAQSSSARTREEGEKEGIFTGAYAVNPLTHERIPIWVANFVLMEYGTGAIMSVPAHDQRDFEFAKKYTLPIRIVIQPPGETLEEASLEAAYEGEGTMVNSGSFTGLTSEAGKEAVSDHLEKQGIGKRQINYRIRDWLISRQRYWGTPIPIIYCSSCGIVPVPETDLPVVLPEDVTITFTGGSPLERIPGFVTAPCPRCGKPARRETDTMDTFVDSSWYFLRFTSPTAREKPLDPSAVAYWMPVDQYIGGIEHAVLHLLYARFFTKVLRDLGLVSVGEPFVNLLTQGMVCHETFNCLEHGWLFPGEVDASRRCRECNRPVEVGRTEKMSKSKKNIVDPDEMMEKYGADATRLFSLFAAPPEKDLEWSDAGVEGAFRFLTRVWRLVEEHRKALAAPGKSFSWRELRIGADLYRKTHQTVQKVTRDLDDSFHFNTAIAALMELLNEMTRFSLEGPGKEGHERRWVLRYSLETLLILLAPFAPHITEELWESLGSRESLFQQPWPTYDPAVVQAEEVLVVVQVDGKLRSRLIVPKDVTDGELEATARRDPKVQPWVTGRRIARVVVVPRKLVNIVTATAGG